MSRFDCSYLPSAQLEFVVLADTHHIVDPDMYSRASDSVTPDLTRNWSARGDWALTLAKDVQAQLAFHVGDLTQEYPGSEYFEAGRQAAVAQLKESGLQMHYAAGNMDIGDKPDPTMPAGWVEPGFLKRWDEDFGSSFYSLSHGDCHFVVLNSQIMNTTLPEALEQHEWFEADLSANASKRIFVFLHLPPFLVDEDEPGLGSYDVLDAPDRIWLLDLLRRYEVEALFSGHTHFQVFNRIGTTRAFTLPSTTTTRPGFYECFKVVPPSRGWADVAKLGFFLVRLTDQGVSVHLIRTSGNTVSTNQTGARLMTRTSRDIPHSPLGTYLRLPIAQKSDGVIAYPNHVRQRIRDDYPLLGCLELGLRHVRFPIHDLDEPLQRDRLGVLREEGVLLTATAVCPEARHVSDQERRASDIDFLEIQLTNRASPSDEDLAALSGLQAGGIVVALSLIVMEDVGKIHRRPRIGYAASELHTLDALLTLRNVRVDRAVCSVDTSRSTWAEIRAFGLELISIKALDFIVQLGEDQDENVAIVGEALFAAATVPNCRVFLDPLQDLDRTPAVMSGLLDRLSNPRPAFHVARVLNTVLYSEERSLGSFRPIDWAWSHGDTTVRGVTNQWSELWLITGGQMVDAAEALVERVGTETEVSVIDPVAGASQQILGSALRDALRSVVDRVTLVTRRLSAQID